MTGSSTSTLVSNQSNQSRFFGSTHDILLEKTKLQLLKDKVNSFVQQNRRGSTRNWIDEQVKVAFQVKLLDLIDLQPFNSRFTIRFELIETWTEPWFSQNEPIKESKHRLALELDPTQKAQMIEPSLIVENSLPFDLDAFHLQKYVPVDAPETMTLDQVTRRTEWERITVTTNGRFVRHTLIKTQMKCLITIQLLPHLQFTCYLRLRSHPLASGQYMFEQLPLIFAADPYLSDFKVRILICFCF